MTAFAKRRTWTRALIPAIIGMGTGVGTDMSDNAFTASEQGLGLALALLLDGAGPPAATLPGELPRDGVGETDALQMLAPHVIGAAAPLGDELAFAHMDPPTPWVAWAATLWNASLNQNLLHPETSPAATDIERRVIDWLAPAFGMRGGHMTPGSTVANLTALWAARDVAGVRHVVSSAHAHLSVRKASHLLGLRYHSVPVDRRGRLDHAALPSDLSATCLVLTAGTTSTGAIDALANECDAAWTHVDAAWGGALALSERHAGRLDGIALADSVAVSAHKWLFQPKESALVLFRDADRAERALASEGGYLARPNVGLLGSRGAAAVPLLATLLAWGRRGIAERIERCLRTAAEVHAFLAAQAGVTVFAEPETGVIAWRLDDDACTRAVGERLPAGVASRATIDGRLWLRHVAANPNAVAERIIEAIGGALPAAA